MLNTLACLPHSTFTPAPRHIRPAVLQNGRRSSLNTARSALASARACPYQAFIYLCIVVDGREGRKSCKFYPFPLLLRRKENVSLTAYCLGLLEKDVEQLKGVQAAGALLPMASPTPLPLCKLKSRGNPNRPCSGVKHPADTQLSLQASCSLQPHRGMQQGEHRQKDPLHGRAPQKLCIPQIRSAGIALSTALRCS